MYAPAMGAWFGASNMKGPNDDPFAVSIQQHFLAYNKYLHTLYTVS